MWKGYVSDFIGQVATNAPFIGGMVAPHRRTTDDGIIKQLAVALAIPLITAFLTAYMTLYMVAYKVDEQKVEFSRYRDELKIEMQRKDDKLSTTLERMQKADQDAQSDLSAVHAEHRMIMNRLGMKP